MPKPCRTCRADIYFDDRKSSSGKPIPMDFRTKEPHNCNLDLIHNFRNELVVLKERLTDMETMLASFHIKERLDDFDRRLEKLESAV